MGEPGTDGDCGEACDISSILLHYPPFLSILYSLYILYTLSYLYSIIYYDTKTLQGIQIWLLINVCSDQAGS